MARAGWDEARARSQRASFDYYKTRLTIKSGARSVILDGVLDTAQDSEQRMRSPDGTFLVTATLSCWRSELGFLPVVDEAVRIAETAKPDEEQLYLVTSVDSSCGLLLVELRASTSNASPFFK